MPVDSGADNLVDRDSATFQAGERIRERFGEEAVVVLAEGDLPELIMTENLGQLLRLEGCLAGRVPPGAKPLPGPCTELARLDPVRSLAGPATFLNGAVIQLDRQLRRLAASASPQRLRELLVSFAARYGISSAPSLTNPDFIAAVVFDLRRARATPKSRLSYLFPNDHTAQILIRLRPDLSDAERARTLDLIRAAVAETTPRAACGTAAAPAPCFALRDGTYLVSGVPVVVEEIAPALRTALLVLLAVAVLVMAATLVLVFATRPRLLPLAVALAAVAITFGLLAATGGSLSVASIAVLPILIGLAVDYAIQLQARFGEAVAGGRTGADAAVAAAGAGGPTIALACLATAAGFAALQLSPTPMVRDFGILLLVGVPLSFLLALGAGLAGLVLSGQGAGAGGPGGRGGRLAAALDGVVAIAAGRPRGVLVAAIVLAALGWGLGTRVETVSDVHQLGPSGLGALRDLDRLQEATGVSGRLDVIVEAPDLTDPAVLAWMDSFKRRALRAGGYEGAQPSCLEAELCPGPAISDFVSAGGGGIGKRAARSTFRALPPEDLAQLATLDPETGLPAGRALLSFGIRAQSLQRQADLIERVRNEVGAPGEAGGPPTGVEVELGGLPVVAAEAADDLDRSRMPLTLAGLLAVAAVLLIALRSARRALLPLVPVALATGWSGLVIWLSGISLDPMSAAFGALTVAIATEFAIILAGRFEEERGEAAGPPAALRAAYARTGPAVVASGATVIAGFAVLLASDIEMLRNFGLVTVIDLGVALLGVLIVLPAVLMLADRGADR